MGVGSASASFFVHSRSPCQFTDSVLCSISRSEYILALNLNSMETVGKVLNQK